METEIVITVVICVHNAEKYLAETLESVAQQTIFGTGGEGIEVIIIDDRSNDSSPEIIRRYAIILEDKGFAVRCVSHSENQSTPKSYTEGASLARGRYFKILDHDDALASAHALSEPVRLMQTMEGRGQSVGVVFSKTLYMNEESKVFGEKHFPFPFLRYEARDGLLPRKWAEFVVIFSPLYPFVHGASVVRKDCWEELSVQHVSQYGTGLFDVEFTVHVAHSPKWHVGYLRNPALKYRIHSSSYTQSHVSRADWIDNLNEQYDHVYKKGPFLFLIKQWTRFIQSLKSRYHLAKGRAVFGGK